VSDPNGERSEGGAAGTDAAWPLELTGVTESVVTTLGPNDLWNVAALGVHAPTDGDGGDDTDGTGYPATWARTWGRTRTWRNFRERGAGVIQFTPDPLAFAEAALTIWEEPDPVIDAADAWVRVDVERVAEGERGGTQWVDWLLHPRETELRRERVGALDRASLAVVEATVAASRLDVPTYDTDELLERLRFYDEVVLRRGGRNCRRGSRSGGVRRGRRGD